MGEEAKKKDGEEEKGCCAKTWDGISAFFMLIFEGIMFIFKQIYNLFWYIG